MQIVKWHTSRSAQYMRMSSCKHPKACVGLFGFHLFFLFLSCWFLLSVYLAPYVISHWDVWELSGDTATIVSGYCREFYAVCQVICHQLPERSFAVCGVPMPICVRCLGLTIGTVCATFVGLFLLPQGDLLGILRQYFFLPENSNLWLLIAVLLLCAVPMILDGGSQLIFPYNSPEPLRFVTGLIFGYFRGCILLSVLSVLLHTAVAKLRRLA